MPLCVRLSTLLAMLFLMGATVQARAGCLWSDLVRGDARAAVLRPASRPIRFVEGGTSRAGCPRAGAHCLSRAYVVPGDVVLTGHVEGAFTCAGFQGARGLDAIGLLPSGALATLAPDRLFPRDGVGRRTGPDQDIAIRIAPGDALAVNGEASWGMGDPWRRANGAVHTGEVGGIARPMRGVLAFTQREDRTLPYAGGGPDDCRVRMIRRGPFPLVRDNGYRGGENVSFTGFYRRR